MSDFESWGARWRRFVCRVLDCDWVTTHAEPVVDLFKVCRRCGKFERMSAAERLLALE